mgnify:CR=1 FL=1
MRNNTYFWKDTAGLKSDIERHRAEEKKFCEKISELESIENPSDMDIRCLAAYRKFLGILLQSKANITQNIGKK